jgi:MoxR-like ATPase
MPARDSMLELRKRIGESIIGQEAAIDRLLIALLADGHVLMEGLPGLAKTRTIKTLAKNLESDFRRIQFTPDLLPADVTGLEVYYDEGGKGSFRFQPGPIFGNLILADEINRAPAKAQAALLEAMEERQVTVSGTTHPLASLTGDAWLAFLDATGGTDAFTRGAGHVLKDAAYRRDAPHEPSELLKLADVVRHWITHHRC